MIKNKSNFGTKLGRPPKIKFQGPKGMHDILSSDQKYFQKIFDVCRKTANWYGFSRIETPILEQADLFVRAVGRSTEIVEKQMYVLKTEGGDVLALRPEGTAPVVRAYIEHGMENKPKPVKLWYSGPFFRHESSQAGRFRQFWQFGFEVLGTKNPVVDVQVIQIFLNILNKLKIKDLSLQINSIGDPKCRSRYKKALIGYLKNYQKELCADCRSRLKKNPLRTLDCKHKKCQRIVSAGPQILDYLCKKCRSHFKQVLELLDALKIPYELNSCLVRGLDYYTRTVFEIFMNQTAEGSEANPIALVGGGRYDNLGRILAGKDISACGGAAGVERIVEIMKAQEFTFGKKKKPKIFLAQLGPISKGKGLELFEKFRKAKIPVYEAFAKDSLRVQLERANQLGTRYTLILGEKEVLEGKAILRDMKQGTQKTLKLDKIVEKIKKKLTN